MSSHLLEQTDRHALVAEPFQRADTVPGLLSPPGDDRILTQKETTGKNSADSGKDDQVRTIVLKREIGQQARDHQSQHQHQQKSHASSSRRLTDGSNKLEPFGSLPLVLDKPRDALLRWYLFHYPRAQYGFNPNLKPHPVHTNFNISLGAPACFKVILARSAMTQASLKLYRSEKEKKFLEQTTLRYKVDAIQAIQRLSVEYHNSDDVTIKDALLASIMSLGNLDRRAGAAESADVHYKAIRQILKSTGGPLAIGNPALRRVSLFFECMYGTSPNSYVWEQSEFPTLLEDLNGFLGAVWDMWSTETSRPFQEEDKSSPSEDHHAAPGQVHIPSFYLSDESTLSSTLLKAPLDPFSPKPADHLRLVWQLTSTFMLVAMVVDFRNDLRQLRSRIIKLHRKIEEGPPKLSVRDPTTNIMWILFQGDGIGPSGTFTASWSSADEKQHSKRIVRVASWMFVCRYLTFNMRMKVKTWLMQFLTGASNVNVLDSEHEMRPLKLNLFDFSYASM